jgi:hypothetical protein
MVQILSVPMSPSSHNLTRNIQKRTTFAAIKRDAGTMLISVPREERCRGDERLAGDETSRQAVAVHDLVLSGPYTHLIS